MSLVGLVSLAERLLNQNPAPGQDTQTVQKPASPQSTHGSQSAGEDQFTPSTQSSQAQTSAQDAGLFRVTQLSFFSAAADFLLGQNAAAPTNLTAGGPPTSNANPSAPQTTNANSQVTQTAVAPSPGTPALAALVQPPSRAGNGTNADNTLNAQRAALATLVPTAATTTGSATIQQQLQTLNQALAALGLSPQDIQQLDRIASVIKDFNPQAYTALVYQLEELAQQNSNQASAPTAANNQSAAGNTNATTTNAPAANGATANSGGFQVQELVIKFSGVEAQGSTQSGANGNTNGGTQVTNGTANGNLQVSAFNLEVEEVNLTLINGNGQTAQIQAPAQNAPTNNPNTNQLVSSPKAQTANA